MATCIFCPNEANSNEDMFPCWTLRYVKTGQPLQRQVGNAPVTVTEEQEVRIPCVCETCNNGWMSRLETKVQKYMKPMIDGDPMSLDRDYQKGLAEWTVKTAMVSDAIDQHPRFFTDAECHAFKHDRTMPHGIEVVAGRFTGRSRDAGGSDFTLVIPPDNKTVVRGHAFTVMVGHLVMQAISMHLEPEFYDRGVKMECNPGPWDTALIQIWPKIHERVEWPPSVSFTIDKDQTDYANFRYRWKRNTGHRVITRKPND